MAKKKNPQYVKNIESKGGKANVNKEFSKVAKGGFAAQNKIKLNAKEQAHNEVLKSQWAAAATFNTRGQMNDWRMPTGFQAPELKGNVAETAIKNLNEVKEKAGTAKAPTGRVKNEQSAYLKTMGANLAKKGVDRKTIVETIFKAAEKDKANGIQTINPETAAKAGRLIKSYNEATPQRKAAIDKHLAAMNEHIAVVKPSGAKQSRSSYIASIGADKIKADTGMNHNTFKELHGILKAQGHFDKPKKTKE